MYVYVCIKTAVPLPSPFLVHLHQVHHAVRWHLYSYGLRVHHSVRLHLRCFEGTSATIQSERRYAGLLYDRKLKINEGVISDESCKKKYNQKKNFDAERNLCTTVQGGR